MIINIAKKIEEKKQLLNNRIVTIKNNIQSSEKKIITCWTKLSVKIIVFK